VHFIARFVFWSLLVLSMTNAIGLYITYVRQVSDDRFHLGIYPIVFVVCAVLIFAFSRRRSVSSIWIAAWVFWVVYALGGFLGEQQITATYIRATLEVLVKPWIALIGLPWLAMRAISEDKVPRLLRVTVLLAAVGALFALLQVLIPGFFRNFSDLSDRGTGFWLNANTCGVICTLALFLSLMCPFRQNWLNWAARLLLIVGVAVSFSRAAIVAIVVAWFVYALASKRFGTLLKSVVGIALFLAGILATLKIMEAASPGQEHRLKMVQSFLEGDWTAHGSDNRTELWAATFHAIERKGGLLFGLGHGSVLRIVQTEAGGVAPHNYYLFVLGNSGLFALLALLAFQFVLFQQAWKCKDRNSRAALLAIATVLTLIHVFDHSLLGYPFTGIMIACITLGTVYAQSHMAPTTRAQRAVPRPSPAIGLNGKVAIAK
jgi:O-antigen ligase